MDSIKWYFDQEETSILVEKQELNHPVLEIYFYRPFNQIKISLLKNKVEQKDSPIFTTECTQ